MSDLSGYLYFRFPYGDQTGDEWRVNCPSCHNDKNKAFINTIDGRANCYHCGWKASSWVGLIAKVEGLNGRAEIAKWIADNRDKITTPFSSTSTYRTHKAKMPQLLPWAAVPVEQDDPYCEYLEKRGFSYITALLFDMQKCSEGKYEGRLIIPVRESGTLTYFFDRSIDPSIPSERKTLGVGTRETYWPVKKSTVVFNLDLATQYIEHGGTRLILAEGIFSALSLGTENVIATLGKSVTYAQIHKIMCTGVKEIEICFDPDAIDSTMALAEKLSAEGAEVFIRRFTLGDPNDYQMNGWPLPEAVRWDLAYQMRHKMGVL